MDVPPTPQPGPGLTPAPPRPDAALAWLSCLADGTRVRLLRLLEAEELGVSGLCTILQLPQSTVSRHLKALADAGFLISRRRGTTRLYENVHDELDPDQADLWRLTRKQTAGWATLAQDAARLAAYRAVHAASGGDDFFAGLAGTWDATREAVYGARLSTAPLAMLLPADARVADFGCGTGSLLAALAPFAAEVHGLDASPEMLAAAGARLDGTAGVSLHRCDLAATPLADASVDAAFCVLVLSYLAEPAAAVAEMARVAKPGGVVAITDLAAHDRDDFRRAMGQTSNGFAEEALAGLLIDAGLTGVRATLLPPDPGATGPALRLARGLKPAA
ncbi:ArsR family transcriptional regulator [Phycisphaera mikurensis]|uniref:Putative ArsR family transcriptional regulator n=1 Tax=Phycisphaera mikurensis (strain NBRC 102666 / KCTC 22515 / FYK2301M01) TaxID=1142394 RepID=I0IB67_PHYMF|nr:ArsR family transcriptional regulator [Phycisphaera mikurensis]MBB6443004.1 ArsR family transcriptional regulator [Phycisphaera mikurensis]BAM02505.1 putative ArsR family transcriptional regulator [Phycisphaera mikurensis NBRC 102666]